MTNTHQSIPLNKLVLSERNVRKCGAEDGLQDLISSIAAHGLLQSLVVQSSRRGKFAVIAGGRRLRAMQRLAEDGKIELSYPVPCNVIAADGGAEELSLAENIVRAPMHPADQFDAFRAIIDQGSTLVDVAARFNVSEDLVHRRLKLGRLSPTILQAYRDEQIDLEEAQAFTLSDDHAEQDRVFAELNDAGHLFPRRIRAALTHAEVPSSDRRVRLIGMEAYVAAGGTVRRDLFDDEDAFYVNDEALLESLVAARLKTYASEIEAEGWNWVKVDPDADFAELAAYERLEPHIARLTKKAQRRIDALTSEYDDYLDAIEGEPSDEDHAKLDGLQAEIDALQPAETWSAECLSQGGAIITLTTSGDITVERGLKIGARPAKRASAEDGASLSSYPARQVVLLTAERTAALRMELARNPKVALAALVDAFASTVCLDARPETCLQVSLRHRHLPLVPEASKATSQINRLFEDWQKLIPQDRKERWIWCLAQPQESLLELLAFLVAQSVDVVQEKPNGDAHRIRSEADRLTTALGMNLRDWFVPTADNFFSHIRRKSILAAIDEATGTHGPALEKLGKTELAQRAGKLVTETSWLPEPIRALESEPDREAA